MRVFVSYLLNENDVSIFETIETRHFNTSNYIRSVVGEVHLLNVINELLLFLSISLIFDVSIHGRKNKTCLTKTLFTNFTRCNSVLLSRMEEFVHCSKDKITCKTDLHFCELWWKQENLSVCVLFPSPPLLS